MPHHSAGLGQGLALVAAGQSSKDLFDVQSGTSGDLGEMSEHNFPPYMKNPE